MQGHKNSEIHYLTTQLQIKEDLIVSMKKMVDAKMVQVTKLELELREVTKISDQSNIGPNERKLGNDARRLIFYEWRLKVT